MDKYYKIICKNFDLSTYYHINKKTTSYSLTIDDKREKICSLKPMTKSQIEKVLKNEHNLYTKSSRREWELVKSAMFDKI